MYSGQNIRRRLTAIVLVLATAGFGMYVGAETPTSHWFGGGHHARARRSSGEVALTFDDGPNVTSTIRSCASSTPRT